LPLLLLHLLENSFLLKFDKRTTVIFSQAEPKLSYPLLLFGIRFVPDIQSFMLIPTGSGPVRSWIGAYSGSSSALLLLGLFLFRRSVAMVMWMVNMGWC
jgi:hypothetical protein